MSEHLKAFFTTSADHHVGMAKIWSARAAATSDDDEREHCQKVSEAHANHANFCIRCAKAMATSGSGDAGVSVGSSELKPQNVLSASERDEALGKIVPTGTQGALPNGVTLVPRHGSTPVDYAKAAQEVDPELKVEVFGQ